MGDSNPNPAASCDCEDLKTFETAIWCMTAPIIACYIALEVVGVSNLLRFRKVNQLSRNLALIYFWSLLSGLSWAFYLGMVTLNNRYQYPPYAIGVYAKILVGIAY